MLVTSILLGIGGSVAAAISVAAMVPEPANLQLALAAPPLVTEATASSSTTVLDDDVPEAPANPNEFRWVIGAGDIQYVMLAAIGDDMPKTGKARMIDESDGSVTAVARVAVANVPEEHLRMTRVRLDTGCVADVRDYAVVGRVIGDLAYAGGGPGEKWSAANVVATGNPVLAARITGCGAAAYGRDAELPAIIQLAKHTDEDLVLAARSALLASAAARTTQTQWKENGGEGTWHDVVPIQTKVLRHPTTGVVWVVAHGEISEGCGAPSANILGLFRVAKDKSLETVEVRAEAGLHAISAVIDIDRDGTPELVGRDWFGISDILIDSAGSQISMLSVPYYGCPC